jgi:hypothetical protein
LTFASVSQRVEDEPEAAASRVNTALHPRADWWSLHAPLFLRGVPPITSILHRNKHCFNPDQNMLFTDEVLIVLHKLCRVTVT